MKKFRITRMVAFLALQGFASAILFGQTQLGYGSGTALPPTCRVDADLFFKTDNPPNQHYFGCVLNTSNQAVWSLLTPVVQTPIPPIPPAGPQWSIGYWNSVGNPSCPVSDIDMSALSHVIHWAALVNANGTLNLSYHNMNVDAPVLIQAAHAAGVKVIFSVVNPYWISGQQGNLATAVANNRAALVSNIMAVVNQYGYDGADVDWEPEPVNIGQLAIDLRAALGASRLLTASAIVTGYRYWGTVQTPFDRINVMTYDMYESTPSVWFNSALFGPATDAVWSVDLAVRRYTAGGVPAGKLGIGIPFYGQQWPFITSPTQPGGTPTQINYRDIVPLVPQRVKSFDFLARVPWLAQPGLISYDDPQSVTEKVQYAKKANLGGWIMWNLSEDYFPNSAIKHPLLSAVKAAR